MDLAEIKENFRLEGQSVANIPLYFDDAVTWLIAEVERLNLQIKTIESCPERCLWIEAATAEVAAECDRYKVTLERIKAEFSHRDTNRATLTVDGQQRVYKLLAEAVRG